MTLHLEELGEEWDTEWDTLVTRNPYSGFMQASDWQRFRSVEGYEAKRLGLFKNETLLGGGVLYFYPAHTGSGFLVCPDAPLLDWEETEQAREGLRLLQRYAERFAPQVGAIGLRIEPRLPKPKPSLLRNWSRAPIDLLPNQTLFLDLTLTPEEFLAQMHPKGRYNLRLAERHGVTVRFSTEMSDLRTFHTLFAETASRHEFFAEPYGFFLNLGSVLFPCQRAGLLFAEWEEKPLAAILVLFFGRRATYLYGGSSGLERHLMPNYLLHWEAIRIAKERGCVEYDMYGYEPLGLRNHLYAGFSRFKKQFGGTYQETIGAHDYIFYDRLADQLVTQLQERREGHETR
jgi:lipid II:glycine glycyltransferase (peptidoglycan interpeptide bridge formation enzyme)